MNSSTTNKWLSDNRIGRIFVKFNHKPIGTASKSSHRLKSAPSNWRRIDDCELERLKAAPENIRRRASKHCSLNGKIHQCLKFDGTVYKYHTALTITDLEELLK